MATSRPGPAQKLVELLESLPAEDRKELTAWLLGMGRAQAALAFGPPPGARGGPHAGPLASGQGGPHAGPLAGGQGGSVAGAEATGWVAELPARQPISPDRLFRLLPPLASALAAGEESQLVTIRLPAERHTQLRTWCSEHGFTMASVVRGLVERFLEEQAGP
jgi:hypothetical protein